MYAAHVCDSWREESTTRLHEDTPKQSAAPCANVPCLLIIDPLCSVLRLRRRHGDGREARKLLKPHKPGWVAIHETKRLRARTSYGGGWEAGLYKRSGLAFAEAGDRQRSVVNWPKEAFLGSVASGI